MSSAHSVLVRIAAIDAMTAPLRKMEMGVVGFAARSEIAIAKLEGRFARLKNGLNNNTFGVGGALLGFGAIQIGASVFEDIKDYHTKLIAVKKTSGLTDQAMLSMSDSFIKSSEKLKSVKASHLAELGIVAGQNVTKLNGKADPKEISRFAEIFSKLEQAAPTIQGEEGAMNVMSVLGITKEGTREVENFASAMVWAGNNVNVTEGALVPMMLEVARGTSKFKLASKEVLGLSTALESLKANPEAAGSVMTRVMNDMSTASTFGGKQLDQYAKFMGKTVNETRQFIKQKPAEAFIELVSGLGKVSDSGGDLNTVMSDLGMTELRTDKVMSSLIVNHKKVAWIMGETLKAYKENTALQKEYEEGQKSLGAATNYLSSAFTNTFLKIMQAGDKYTTLRKAIEFVARNLETLIHFIFYSVTAYVAVKTALMAYNAVLWLSSTALGVHTFMTNAGIVSLGANTVALRAYAFMQSMSNLLTWAGSLAMGVYFLATGNATAATIAFSAALAINPFTWIILGIAAAVIAVGLLIYYWDDLVSSFQSDGIVRQVVKIAEFVAAFFPLYSIIASVIRNWDLLVAVFKNGSFLDIIRVIGFTIFDMLISPIQYLLELIDKVAGTDMASSITKFKAGFEASLDMNKAKEPINTKAEKATFNSIKDSKESREKVTVDFQNMPSGVSVGASSGIGVGVKDTFGLISKWG